MEQDNYLGHNCDNFDSNEPSWMLPVTNPSRIIAIEKSTLDKTIVFMMSRINALIWVFIKIQFSSKVGFTKVALDLQFNPLAKMIFSAVKM